MRIWHEKLISKLCRPHLLAMWREGLGCLGIVCGYKKGYRFHPQVKEFMNHDYKLYNRLYQVREEMLKRGYYPKPLPNIIVWNTPRPRYTPWQSLQKQTEILRAKGCQCQV